MAKKRNVLCESIFETLKDFTEHTSIHGMKYLCQKNVSFVERLFWALVTICGAGMAIFMTSLFWSRYTSNPTRTTITTLHAPTVALPFPAVTLCNENVVFESKIDKFIETLEYGNSTKEDLKSAFLKLQILTEPTKQPWYAKEMKFLSDVLNENNYNLESVITQLGQSCKELLVKCQWNFNDVNCMDLFLESYSKSGMCCTFLGFRRMKNQPTYTNFHGTEGTLSIVINPLVEQNKHLTEPKGLKVLFHDVLSYPDFRALRKIIMTGTQTHMQILGTRIMCSAEVAELAIHQRDCVFPGEVQLKYFKTYTDANCLIEREAEELTNVCDCIPYYYDFSDKPKCNLEQMYCIIDLLRKNNSWDESGDNCPAPCEDFLYAVKTTYIKLEKGNFYNIKSENNLESFNEHTTHLKIYFVEFQKILQRDLMVSTVSLMASFGGIYSLFLGCSLLTGCEIIYYCTLRLLLNIYWSGKRNHSQ